jgi:aspartate/methionine/tyrosine aminotransferase
MIMNTPNHPAATMYARLELQALAEVIGRYDLWVFSDEVYHDITFGQEHVSFASIPGMAERTLVFDSASKTDALGGERVGAVAGGKRIIAEIAKNKTHGTFSSSLAGQKAIAASLTDPLRGQYMEEMRADFQRRRDLMASVMRADFPQAARCHLPQGTFYFSFELPAGLIVPGQYKEWMDASMRFSIYLLNQKQVAVTPGQAAGYPTLIRLSCAVDDESIKSVSRIGEALKELGVR